MNSTTTFRKASKTIRIAAAVVLTTIGAAGVAPVAQARAAKGPALIVPGHLKVDRALPARRAALTVLRARQLYTFWDTGSPAMLRRAVVANFVDHTPPLGRRQGRGGVLAASRAFRAAIPDLSCELADLTVVGDRVTARQVYRGHFTGVYNGVKGTGQPIRFNAIDIQQMGRKQIIGDWHIEDTVTLERQLGVAG